MDEIVRMKICEEYKEIYREENFYLCGTCLVNVPVLQYLVDLRYEEEQALNPLEKAVLGCMEKGISRAERISCLLGIDDQILSYALRLLSINGYILFENEQLLMTEKGHEVYRKNSKRVSAESENFCCFNGLTGEWMTEEEVQKHQLIQPKEVENPEREIWLDILYFAHFNEEEQTKRRLAELYRLKGKEVTELNLSKDYTVRFHSYLLLFYKNKKEESRILCVDGCGNEEYAVDFEVSREVLHLYENHQILELVQIYKDVKVASMETLLERYEMYKGENEVMDELIELLLERCRRQDVKTKWVSNQEMRQAFLDSIKQAEQCLYIISPWINKAVVTEEVLKDMENLLEKGVSIHIIYGIETEQQMQDQRDIRNLKTGQMAERMKERFEKYGELFTIRHGSTHEKILICDKKYCISGSMNFLSYDGGESTNYSKGHFRGEGGFCCYDEEVIQQVIEIHFGC